MRKLMAVLVFTVFLLSSLQTVSAGTFSRGTYQTCSTGNLTIYQNLLNANITNLTAALEKDESQLNNLYHEWEATKNTSVLFEIVKLRNEIRSITNELEYLKRQKLDLELVENYTVETPYGRKVLNYKLPSESAIVQEYIKKVHPVRTDVDLAWFVSYYRQAAELTFTQIVQTDMGMRELLKKVKDGNYTSGAVSEILTLLSRRQELWREFYKFAWEKEKLQTLKTLKEIGRKQTLIATTTGVEPLAIHFGGIAVGHLCSSCSERKPPLPGVYNQYDADQAPYVQYLYFSPVAVWVGIYLNPTPDIGNFWGDYCTYEFPETQTDLKKYWDRAVALASPHFGSYFYEEGSIQAKLFYEGSAYNAQTHSYQESNIIWQVECNKNGCWVVTNYLRLPQNPDVSHYNEYYKLYLNTPYLQCCGGGDVKNSCDWGNRHCNGCFAPDSAASQNFAICTKDEYGSQCGWEWITRW